MSQDPKATPTLQIGDVSGTIKNVGHNNNMQTENTDSFNSQPPRPRYDETFASLKDLQRPNGLNHGMNGCNGDMSENASETTRSRTLGSQDTYSTSQSNDFEHGREILKQIAFGQGFDGLSIVDIAVDVVTRGVKPSDWKPRIIHNSYICRNLSLMQISRLAKNSHQVRGGGDEQKASQIRQTIEDIMLVIEENRNRRSNMGGGGDEGDVNNMGVYGHY